MPHARSALAAPAAVVVLRAMIQASPIRMRAGVRAARTDWPADGYDGTDRQILDWIASHRRGPHGRFLLH